MDGSERELLRGKLAGIFNNPPIVLTNKRLIVEERSIYLGDILEVYAKQGYVDSELVIRLKNGLKEEYKIAPEKAGSVGSFLAVLSGDIAATEGDLRAQYKATTDRWVNLINRLLTGSVVGGEEQTVAIDEAEEACGKCVWYKTPDCSLNAVDVNASPCPDYKAGRKVIEQSKPVRFFCRYCGSENKEDAVFCEKCGKKIGANVAKIAKPEPTLRKEIRQGNWQCPRCYRINAATAKLCTRCGEPQSKQH